jgi:hypothetical protein
MSVGTSATKDRFASAAEQAAADERAIQEQIDRKQKGQPKQKQHKGAMQAGARRYPEPPFPKQHLAKPGDESHLDLKPMYDAPHYKGSEKLKGKVALITGGDSGIGRAVAVLFAREGADAAVAYLTEHTDAEETKKAVQNEGRRCVTMSGDVADPEFCKEAVERTSKELGHLDILVNNAASVARGRPPMRFSTEGLSHSSRATVRRGSFRPLSRCGGGPGARVRRLNISSTGRRLNISSTGRRLNISSSGRRPEGAAFVYVLLFRVSLRLVNRLVGLPVGSARFLLLLGESRGRPESGDCRTHHRDKSCSHGYLLKSAYPANA